MYPLDPVAAVTVGKNEYPCLQVFLLHHGDLKTCHLTSSGAVQCAQN